MVLVLVKRGFLFVVVVVVCAWNAGLTWVVQPFTYLHGDEQHRSHLLDPHPFCFLFLVFPPSLSVLMLSWN